MYGGDIYSCSVGNPFISDSETNHIINSHTHSGQLEKQSVCSVPEGLSEISSLAWKTLSLTPSLYEIISLHFLHVYLLHEDASYSDCLYCSYYFISFCPLVESVKYWWSADVLLVSQFEGLHLISKGSCVPLIWWIQPPLLFPLHEFVHDCMSSIHLH